MSVVSQTATLLILSLFFASAFCGEKSGKLDPGTIISQAFAGEMSPSGAELLLNRRVNLDSDPDLETAALISHGGGERLVFLKKAGGEPERMGSRDFILASPGTYLHGRKGWVRSKQKAKSAPGRIVQRLVLRPIGKGAKINSVLVEYLLEKPGGGVTSALLIFTGGRLSFDSTTALIKYPPAQKVSRIPYRFTRDNELYLFPGNSGYEVQLRYNGREMVLWYPGDPMIEFLPLKIKKGKGSDEPLDVLVELRNVGNFSMISYISASFPEGGRIKPLDKNVRMYRKGSRIFGRTGNSIVASHPLLEVTQRGWRPYYRARIHFQWQPVGKGEPLMLLRVVSRRQSEGLPIPPESGSVPTVKDQQGYQAYSFNITGR